MARHPHLRRRSRPVFALALLAAVAALTLGGVQPALTDDTELLRFSTQSPYLMILLDTSRSMNLPIANDTPLPGQGDDPDSRIYAAKEALFSVFRNVDDVNFGFASFNQDQIRVRGKHWLYYVKGGLPGSYPDVGWPRPSPNDPMVIADPDNDGIMNADRNPLFTDNGAANGSPSDLVSFGTAFRDAGNNPIATAGTCASPLLLGNATDRARLNSFAKNGSDNLTTTLWVRTATGNRTYRLTLERNGAVDALGNSNVPIKISADLVANCAAPPAVSAGVTIPFVKQDVLDDYLFIDNGPAGEGNGEDITGHHWPWKDAVNNFTCAGAGPFTGYGMEGNYDSGWRPSNEGIPAPASFENAVTNVDTFCITPGNCIATKPITQTDYDTRGRPLDTGDFLPWDWNNPNKQAFLRRLAPNWNGGNTPDFGVAGYYEDSTTNPNNIRALKDPNQKPLIAEGDTAIAHTLVDLRCWYMATANETGQSKCRTSPFGTDFDGWRNIACRQNGGDPNFGCRRPFIIIISDGDDDGGGCKINSPVAAVSDMDQHSAVKTWYLMVGPVKNNHGCQGSGRGNSITNAGGGECVVVSNKQELLDTINNILGVIREQTRAFASAAVPTVQATIQQSIYVSNFTPLRSSAVWDGHMNAFLKPLPLLNGKPDTTRLCSALPADQQAGCFLWDAGKVVVDTQYPGPTACPAPNPPNPLGPCPAPGGSPTDWTLNTRRRVYYSMLGRDTTWPTTGTLARNARLFQTTVKGSTDQDVERDLWSALGLAFNADPTDTNDPVRNTANAAITRSLTLKQALVQGESTVRKFLLGDVFHSDPVVVGNPADTRYFAADIGHVNGTVCDAVPPTSNADLGYRCFFTRHKFRRKVLLVGHNDGALHAYNAGIYNHTTKKFSNGTGNELFAYIPRTVMPSVHLMAQSGATNHRFTVDASPVVTDAFIDPDHDGTPTNIQRQWRTVVIGGLREGGPAYYALDITQPDVLSEQGDGEIVGTNTSDANWVPTCIDDFNSFEAECGPVPYGAPLWEFTDSSSDQIPTAGPPPATRVLMDEDRNGFSDLGDTWSVPDVGRIRICTGADCTTDVEDRYVTIFGGGLDPDNKSAPKTGTFVYMVDIETGRVLYKRALPDVAGRDAGAIPAAPAVVDLDNDGYLDRLYIVTTAGFVYRIDLGKDAGGKFPELLSESARTTAGTDIDVLRVDPTFWQPRAIFDGSYDATTNTRLTRPIYYRPSVFFVAKLGLAGLAFGSGEREDLWTTDNLPGRFWVFVDDTDRVGAVLPYDERQFLGIDIASATVQGTTDLFTTRARGEKGWYFIMGNNQRLITPGFSLFGVLFFSNYEPLTFATTAANCDPLNPPPGGCPVLPQSCAPGAQDDTGYCAKTGTSRLFVVNITNGDGLLPTASSTMARFKAIAQFVTQPFTEPGQNKNPTPSSGTPTADDLTADDIRVMNVIKGLFPSDCRFSNFRVDVKTIASDTSVQRIAAVPLCIVQKNWKEF